MMRIIRTEKEIIDSWGMSTDEPTVSICCITYNHASYIKECIEGFLIQITSFPIEVLIHDDCSTDRTVEIIKGFENSYPNIIKLIAQEKNQYSLGVNPDIRYNFSRARGKYIALCEGDDFWIDELKLKCQVDLMEKNLKYNIVFSKAVEINENGRGARIVGNWPTKVLPCFYAIARGGGCMPTPTLLIRAKTLKSLPSFVEGAPIGDFFYQAFASYPNGAIFFNKASAAYRRNSSSSISRKLANADTRLEFLKKMIEYYTEFQKYLPGQKFGFWLRRTRFKLYNFLHLLKNSSVKNAFRVFLL